MADLLATQNRKKIPKMKKTTACMIVFFACLALCACATVPPSGPILKIEAGMHTALIRQIATDAQNRFLVTGSEDKTVRVWNIHDGRLLTVLLPPIGSGHEGKVYAVAISPDGNTIACGGYTGRRRHRSCAIYLFNRSSGALIHRIPGMPNVINHLAYSSDGQYLAAALWESGIRVFRTSDYRQVGEDKDYGGQSYSLDFNAHNRLVTSCYDGDIRLYESVTDAKMTPTVKKMASGGKLPFGVSFSPEGIQIAVCFADSTKIDVRSAGDLSLLYAPIHPASATAIFQQWRGPWTDDFCLPAEVSITALIFKF
jgi:WD40 repeat protein